MTPAKLVALWDKRMDRLDMEERPIAQLAYLFLCSKRDPGDPGANPPRTASPEIDPDSVRIYKRSSKRSLAAKPDDPKPGGKHNVLGAKANRSDFEAMGKGRTRRLTRTKEK